MKAEFVCPDTNHAPSIQHNDPHRNNVEHGLRTKSEPFLDVPIGEDPNSLRGNTDDQEVRKLQRIVSHDLVLKRADDRHSRVQRVSQQEITDQVRQALLHLPDLRDGAIELPETGQDDVHTRVLARSSLFEDEPGDGEE